MVPPIKIDNATVIEWAWSDTPFGHVPCGDAAIPIHGLALASYDGKQFYLFSCDKEWDTVQDSVYPTLNAAKEGLPVQYKKVIANWIRV
jgi:hypothetical protein